MLGLTRDRTLAPHPTLLPKTKREERRVFLDPSLWEELSDVAEFHSEVFAAMGAQEKVSRNDLIESFLTWAMESYWEDKGGRPISREDREKKVRRSAEHLKKVRDSKQQ